MTALTEVRPQIVAALEGGPWTVLGDMPDAVQTPALIVAWGNPWLEVQTACNYRAAAVVICVANRLTPGTGLETLEQMVSFVILSVATTLRVPVSAVAGPQALDISGVTYLTARVPVVVPINLANPVLDLQPVGRMRRG